MSYIGNTSTTQAFTPAIDYFSGNGSTTAFTLSRPVASVAQVQVVVNNVAQNPSSAYTVSGNTITFTSAPSSGTNNIYVYYTSPITQFLGPWDTTGTNISYTGGNVGIGTSSPAYKLDVSGASVSVGATGTGNPSLQAISTDAAGISYLAVINATRNYSIRNEGTAGALTFRDNTAIAERMRINSSGNVGIGTSSPSARLNIVDATSQDALRITQTGTGNALVVEDSPNPDSTPFVIDALGRVITGILATQGTIFGGGYNPQIQIWGIGPATASQSFASFNTANAGNGSRMWLTRSRGSFTAGVPTYGIVSNGDTLGDIQFSGDDGTVGGNFVTAAQILAQVDGTPGANDMPGRLVFSTTADGGSSPTERMRIDSSGNVLVTNAGGGLGYGTGSGGTVTQATSKSTAVTLNKPTGRITMNGAALAASTTVEFTFNNSLLSSDDCLILTIIGNVATAAAYNIGTRSFGAGICTIGVRNITAGSLSESIQISFAIIKGATS